MGRTIELVEEAFKANSLQYRVEEHEEITSLILNTALQTTSVMIHYYSRDDRDGVSVRIPNFVNFIEKDRATVLRVVNECNGRYRYAKFTLDNEHHAVQVEYDIPQFVSEDELGAIAMEVFRRLMLISNEAFPRFMRAIYGKPEKPIQQLGNITFRDVEV
ncbi:MAG TPA: hypothetical protein DCG49_10930 [Ruminococcus sp.]|nr:hypothetical protein [Ruminococcus sp.]